MIIVSTCDLTEMLFGKIFSFCIKTCRPNFGILSVAYRHMAFFTLTFFHGILSGYHTTLM